jgi:transposase
MAYREVTLLEVKEVLRLWLIGLKKKRIAAQLGFDVKTVRRYIAAAQAHGLIREGGPDTLQDTLLSAVMAEVRPVAGRPHGDGWACCEKHRALIEQLLGQGLRLTKVRKLLRRQEIQISYGTLRRFAGTELGFGRGAPTVAVADCGPGEELQCDTGWMTCLEPDLSGLRRRFRAWIFTSVLSRHRFVYPVFQETTATAIEACEAAWHFFEGIFHCLIVDNTKAIVARADSLSPKIVRGFLEYAQLRGFVIDTTRIHSPRDKARVERAVRPVREDCFAGEKLRSIEEARELGRRWCLNEYGMRRHSRTQRMPLEHFQTEERAFLHPAPTEAYDIPIWSEPKVARDHYAQVAKALYSLPTKFIGKVLEARADRTTVRFYLGGAEPVKTHPRVAPGQRSTDPNDFPPEKTACALRDVAFLARQACSHGEAVGRYASALLQGSLPWTRMRQVYALLGLARRYGSARLNEACRIALEADMVDVYRLRRLLEVAGSATEVNAAKVVPIARYLRPASQYRLPLSPQTKTTTEGEEP